MAILFFDIDGTLAIGTNVPASAAEAIARTRKKGNLVFICTGRPRTYAEAHFGAYADGFVCCNGRLATRGDDIVLDKHVSRETVDEILAILDSFDIGYAFFGVDGLYYGGNERFRHIAEEVHGELGSLDEALEEGLDLFSYDIFFREIADRDRIAEALTGISLVNPHGPHPSADLTITGYGKGDAVVDISKNLGVPIEDVYAFGDGVNDISMLEAAGTGIALGNALPEVKEVADYITTDIDQDGVANAIAHFGLA